MRMKTDEKWHYDQFAALLNYCSELIMLLRDQNKDSAKKADAAKKIEDNADSIMEKIVDRLRSVKRLPFEKQTVLQLAHNMDNVVDELEKAADRMKSYRVSLDDAGEKMLTLLAEAIEEAKLAVLCLIDKSFDRLEAHCARIKELESCADLIHRKKIADITDEKDEVIAEDPRDRNHYRSITDIFRRIEYQNRLEQVIEILERAFDQAQDIADLLEQLKYELE